MQVLVNGGANMDDPVLECGADAGGVLSRAELRGLHPVHAVAQWIEPSGLKMLNVAKVNIRQKDARSAKHPDSCKGKDAKLTVGGSKMLACEGEAIHHAAKWNRVENIKFLLAQGVPIDAPDGVGATPLHWAAGFGRRDAIEFLLSTHAPTDVKDSLGRDAVFWATHTDMLAGSERTDVLRLLQTHRSKAAASKQDLEKTLAPTDHQNMKADAASDDGRSSSSAGVSQSKSKENGVEGCADSDEGLKKASSGKTPSFDNCKAAEKHCKDTGSLGTVLHLHCPKTCRTCTTANATASMHKSDNGSSSKKPTDLNKSSAQSADGVAKRTPPAPCAEPPCLADVVPKDVPSGKCVRIDASKLSLDEFHAKIRNKMPVVLTGLTKEWKLNTSFDIVLQTMVQHNVSVTKRNFAMAADDEREWISASEFGTKLKAEPATIETPF